MRLSFLSVFLLIVNYCFSQSLTVEKIMQDPKWIGTSPSGVFWGADSKTVYFSWNPGKNVSDSIYKYIIGGKEPEKAGYLDALAVNAGTNGIYNVTYTLMAYVYRGDVYLNNMKTGVTTRVTQTEDFETNPRFIMKDEWLVYNRNQNLFAWNMKTGITRQLTNITKADPSTLAVTTRIESGRKNDSMARIQTQDQWLQQQQLATSQILRERKDKRNQRNDFLKTHRETDTLRIIGIGEKSLQNLQVSPDGRFVTYRLFQPPVGTKQAIVPDYVTESGYTTDINARTKVGSPQGKFEFYVYDRNVDKLMPVSTDSIPGITDVPDYTKDYPAMFANRKAVPRGVIVSGPYWNDGGTYAFVDIRSQDNKDRWIMQLDATTGKLKLLDRQRDEAWIGGPGVGNFGAKIGWIDDGHFYYQSEATGYSHLYVYDVVSGTKKALTSGNYEVQDVVLSKGKKVFYIVTNEEHPGKQQWCRINADGTKKEKITSLDGGYEVTISPDEKYIAYRYSYTNKPWELFVQENAPGKKPVQVTNKAMSAEFSAYPWRDAMVTTFTASDGAKVYTRVYEPAAGKKNKAAVIFVHGAGYLQNVHYWWSSYFREYMFNNLLADKGYTVIDIDYRASSGYGRDWRTGIYRWMGGKDLDDHIDAAKFLVEKYGIDPARIGIYGGSYGGFITLMGLFTKPDVFKAGAALRPVTDWAHYNHGYTSNILNEPFMDSIAYAKSSPINFAGGLKNRLLICHGMVDVNVHFQDVVRLSQRLIELGKNDWELAVFPVEDHGFVEPSSWTDEYKRILKLFDSELLK
jgi:dipeptidyl aminopeptidase/acylaminoacyl peptidase